MDENRVIDILAEMIAKEQDAEKRNALVFALSLIQAFIEMDSLMQPTFQKELM